MKADLHTHTTFSDGKYDVNTLIDIAIQHGIDVLSITDHDCFDGSKQAMNLHKPIRIVIGIELSTYYNEESVHILGYFKDVSQIESMQPVLDDQIAKRRIRAFQMLDNLETMFGIRLNPSFVKNIESVTRGSIAREIIRQGYPYTNKEIFKTMIGHDCPAYIPATKFGTADGIHLIQKSGGLAILAHPMNLKDIEPQEIINLGVDGIEAVYPYFKDQEGLYRKLASENHLIITGGTDFHAYNDGRHGNIGDVFLKGADVDLFLKVLYER